MPENGVRRGTQAAEPYLHQKATGLPQCRTAACPLALPLRPLFRTPSGTGKDCTWSWTAPDGALGFAPDGEALLVERRDVTAPISPGLGCCCCSGGSLVRGVALLLLLRRGGVGPADDWGWTVALRRQLGRRLVDVPGRR